MSRSTQPTWLLRAGTNNCLAPMCFEKGMVGVGFGPLDASAPPAHWEQADQVHVLRLLCPSMSATQCKRSVSALRAFCSDLQQEHTVLVRDPHALTLGTVRGSVQPGEPGRPLPLRRRVEWTRRVALGRLSQEARRTLGTKHVLTHLSSTVADEVRRQAEPLPDNAFDDFQNWSQRNLPRCSRCGSTDRLHLVTMSYGEDPAGRTLVYCRRCRPAGENVSIPLQLVTPELLAGLYAHGYTQSAYDCAPKLAFGASHCSPKTVSLVTQAASLRSRLDREEHQ